MDSLRSGHRACVQGRDMKTAVVRRPKFTGEQKARALEHYLTHGRCAVFTIQALAIPGGPLFTLGFSRTIPRSRQRVLGASSNDQKHLAVLGPCTL